MNTRLLDITRDHCPMTFVKTKLEMEKLAAGERLEGSVYRVLIVK
ncbi:MAG: sulfurtransferase TusA family protein [Spirochaetia bacterium]